MGPVAAGSEGGVTGKLKGSCPVGVSLLREDGVRGSCLQAEAQQSQLAVRVASLPGADHVHHGSQCGPFAWPDHVYPLATLPLCSAGGLVRLLRWVGPGLSGSARKQEQEHGHCQAGRKSCWHDSTT